MFNLDKINKNKNILEYELSSFSINIGDNSYSIRVGDEYKKCYTLSDCICLIEKSIEELKDTLYNLWNELNYICNLIIESNFNNTSTVQNNLFIKYLNKSYNLSILFSKLECVSLKIVKVLDKDISKIHKDLIKRFNDCFINIYCCHNLIMEEYYRIKILKEYRSISKESQISGPWINMDLPMSERVWSGKEDEEYFDLRTRARKNQPRYNPEYTQQGFYYVFTDFNRDPYEFKDRLTDSPYRGSSYYSIP